MTLINYLNLLKKHNETIFNEIAYSFIGEIELINGIESTTNYNLPKLEFVETGVEYPIDYREASDGTIHFLAIMTALKAVDKKIIAIEEPERSLHMRTLYYIVSQCRNSNKQIFITTHSSELLKMLKPQEISFVYRDRNGNSKVKMASQIPYLSKMMKRTKYDIVELIQTGIIGNFEDDE
jgi:predicted ATPase